MHFPQMLGWNAVIFIRGVERWGDGSNPAHGQSDMMGAAIQSAEVFALP
jgi:hypothetical protein